MTSDLRQREFHPLKILHHVDRLQTLAAGRDVAPVTVEIDPVAYCNHSCPWCVDPVHYPTKMSEETFQSLVTELADFSVEGFRVEGIVLKGGGEPTLHPTFGWMVETGVKSGFEVGVVTNGSRLAQWADVLGRQASYVRVSIDGPTPESHSRIHGSDDFEEIVAGVERLVAACNGRRHPILGLSFAMDVHEIDLAEQAVQLGERLGVDYVLLRPPFFEEVGRKSTMTIDQAEEVRRRLRELVSGYRGRLDLLIGTWIGDAERRAGRQPSLDASGRRGLHAAESLPIEHRTGRCPASPLLAVVAADGTVFGCCNLRALPEWRFGRLAYAEGVGFRAVWQGDLRRAVLARMHRTECINHCTHPLTRYNEMIEVMRDQERPHSQFV